MEAYIAPEVTNPVPLNSIAAPTHVNGDGEMLNDDGFSRSSSTARINDPARSSLTELTGDDIFRMKDLRNSDSVSVSEVAEHSVSVFDDNVDNVDKEFESESNTNGRNASLFDPEATQDKSIELNEEDIFRMKSLSVSRANAQTKSDKQAGQSTVSEVDSTSNFDEHFNAANDDDNASGDQVLEDQVLDDQVLEDQEDYFKALPQTDLTFAGHFVFNRNRALAPDLNKDTVIELYYPFDTLCQPPNGISSDSYLKMFRQSKVYLIGTAHFSKASQEDVKRTIAETQPDAIFVELCQSRMAILSLDEEVLLREAQNLNREKIMAIVKENGVVQGLLQVMLLSISAHITQQLGLAPGGEFRAAHRASFNVQGSRLIMGDRPVQITLQRALSSLGIFQKLRLVFHILIANFSNVTQEDVEKCKDKDLLESLLAEMAGEFPQLSKIFVDERDQYMTHVLHSILQKYTAEKIAAWSTVSDNVEYQPLIIVGVVGLGHMRGIETNWNRHIDSTDLLTVPEASRIARFLRFGVRVAVFGAVGYGIYKVGKLGYSKFSPILRLK